MKTHLSALLVAGSIVMPAQAALIHQYDLNGSFADSFGGPALVGGGGVLGPAGYSFGVGQGLSLPNPGVGASYRIELVFNLDIICNAKYCKLVDFQNLASDNGLYTAPNNALNLYNVALGSTAVGNTPVTVAITRDAGGAFNAYLNGALEFTIADDTGVGNVSNNILWFFQDEGQQGNNPGEYASGFVDSIRIFDTPAGNPVPEPAALLLSATGILALLAVRRRPT